MASTITLQSVVDYARTFAELTPVLAVGGQSQQPALSIAQDVMGKMLGPTMPWKWNRILVPPFYTNAWQQDYGVPGISNLKWIENATWVDVNNTSTVKPVAALEAVRDIQPTSSLFMPPAQVAWVPNQEMAFGTWPGANVTYTNPVGIQQAPNNPSTQIRDTNGNLLVLTTYGTTGSTAPALPASAPTGTTVTDGTVIWTALDPLGQGFRLSSIPTAASLTYQINIVGQARSPMFSSLKQTLAPIPDDHAPLFRSGFVACAYRHSPEAAVRSRYTQEVALWMQELSAEVGASNRERNQYGFYPAQSLSDGGYTVGSIGPAWPFAPGA